MTSKNLHLIGHSLGAQTSSYIAKRTNEGFKILVDRITAMDPAQPNFEKENHLVRLDKSDATFIDVIHTNGAPFIPNLGFRFMFSAGDLDIYINEGMKQPDCVLPIDILKVKNMEDLAKFPVQLLEQLASLYQLRNVSLTPASHWVLRHLYSGAGVTLWHPLGHMARFVGTTTDCKEYPINYR